MDVKSEYSLNLEDKLPLSYSWRLQLTWIIEIDILTKHSVYL